MRRPDRAGRRGGAALALLGDAALLGGAATRPSEAARRPAARKAAPAAAAADAGEARIENATLRLGVSAAGGAHLTSLYAVRQGRELLRPGARTPLYQIDLLRDGKTTAVDASQASSTRLEKVEGGVTLIARHEAAGIEVAITLTLAPDATAATLRAEVRRQGEQPVIGILRAPGLAFALDAGSPGPGALVPVADGELIGDLASSLRDGEVRSWNYPGMASAQLLAIQDARGGAVLYCEDATGRFKRLALRRIGRDVLPYFEHVLVDLKGATVAVPYAVRLGVFDGGWEQAADPYRAWASKQPFCARRIEARDLPEAARAPAFFLGVNLREAAPGGGARDRTADIPAVAASWAKGLGLPVTAILLGWEKQGPWITPDTWPPYGGLAGFGGLVGALHQDAGRAFAYVSGLNITLEKAARNGAPAYRLPPADVQRFRAAAIADQGGAPRLEGQAEGEGIGRHAVLCPTTTQARDLLAGQAAHLLDAGVDLVQVDQIPGGGTPPCFATTHGHPPAGGSAAATALAALLDGLGTTAHARRPAAAITLEEPGEFFIPHVDLFHCRDYMQGLWPRDGRGSVGVPLFAYLFHDYAAGYGGDSAPIARVGDDPSLALYAQAMNLAAGRLPGAAVWMQLIRWDEVHPEQRRFMRAAADLWRSPAGRYLLAGRLLALGLPPGTVTVTGRAGGAPVRFEAPAFHARGFELADGSVGLLYINATDVARTERLGFGPGREQARATTIWPEAGGAVQAGDQKTLPPRGILFLKVERG